MRLKAKIDCESKAVVDMLPVRETRDIGLSSIGFCGDARLRKLRPKLINELAESIRQQGLLQPIVVCLSDSTGYQLIAGRHRLEAARKLKWEAIRADVWEGLNGDDLLLAEIDENLVRGELSPAERAMHVAKRKEIYETKHPETKRGGDRKSTKSRSQNATLIAPAFIDDTAAKTGKHRATVARDAKRGNQPDLADVIGTSLDKGDELDALATLPDDKRSEIIAEAKAGKKVSARTEAKKFKREANPVLRTYETSCSPFAIVDTCLRKGRGIPGAEEMLKKDQHDFVNDVLFSTVLDRLDRQIDERVSLRATMISYKEERLEARAELNGKRSGTEQPNGEKSPDMHTEISISPTVYIELALSKGKGFAEAAEKLLARHPGAIRAHRFSEFLETLKKQIQERNVLLDVINDYLKRSDNVDEEAD